MTENNNEQPLLIRLFSSIFYKWLYLLIGCSVLYLIASAANKIFIGNSSGKPERVLSIKEQNLIGTYLLETGQNTIKKFVLKPDGFCDNYHDKNGSESITITKWGIDQNRLKFEEEGSVRTFWDISDSDRISILSLEKTTETGGLEVMNFKGTSVELIYKKSSN